MNFNPSSDQPVTPAVQPNVLDGVVLSPHHVEDSRVMSEGDIGDVSSVRVSNDEYVWSFIPLSTYTLYSTIWKP